MKKEDIFIINPQKYRDYLYKSILEKNINAVDELLNFIGTDIINFLKCAIETMSPKDLDTALVDGLISVLRYHYNNDYRKSFKTIVKNEKNEYTLIESEGLPELKKEILDIDGILDLLNLIGYEKLTEEQKNILKTF